MADKKYGIIGAMEVEVETLLGILKEERTLRKASMEFHQGRIGGTEVVVVRSGVAKVNAALCVQILVDEFAVTHVINTGVAGSLDARINIGDIVLSTDACYHDVDATIFGYKPGEVPQLGCAAFPADEALRQALKQAVSEAAPDVQIFEGRVVSGDQFIADAEKKQHIKETVGGLCCEMEGAAIAQAAYLNGLPFCIVRAISDKADGSDVMDYPVFEKKAAADCAKLVQRYLTNQE
ncbi:MAG: 5'-methylthioadenosine/adenosylhomocysteine nucleosidase [Lachnospiraceae bacterium]|jgi:adenosylhomocysteine nucleosidase|nr:5'-methylthioadenosine/adenosylhomocysteine nucleosidase [Lachnospiraceae bacterium]